jgi:selenocysteine-specific elongation factor
MVLDPAAPARKRRSPERTRRLEALERFVAGEGVTALLEHSPRGISLSELTRLTGLPLERITLPPDTLSIEAGSEQYVFCPSHWDALRERVTSALQAFHAQVPDEPGPDIGRLRRMAVPELSETLWRALVSQLAMEQRLERNGPWLHLPEHAAVLTEEDQCLVHKLQPMIAHGGFNPPWVRDLAAASREPEERVRTVLRKSVAQGTVYQVVRDLFYDRGSIGELASIIARLARENGAVDAARYRDALGVGRKRSVQILEFFDRVGYTRRVRDSHLLRPDSGWPL